MRSLSKDGPIVVTGHPYAYSYYFKVFEFVSKENYFFVLPKVWRARVTIKLHKLTGFKIYGLRAVSYGRQSFLGGPFKGWLPGMLLVLPYLRLRYGAKILYSCSEPNLLTTLFNGLLAKILGMKLVLFTWQNISPESRMKGLKLKLSNWLVLLNLKLADGIICGNKKAAEIMSKLSSQLPVLVCPLSGIDVEKFAPGPKGEWNKKFGIDGEKIVLFYGVLDNRKGVDILIRAFQKLSSNARLVIVGSGPNRGSLEVLVDELSLTNKVFFVNWMDNNELPKLLNDSDVFVYPSVPYGGWEEQFGYAMAEASACGVPVIATQVGSIGEVVHHNKTGILVEPGNPEQLAIAINKLLSDDGLRKNMGVLGRDYIVSNFSQKVVASRVEGFLTK